MDEDDDEATALSRPKIIHIPRLASKLKIDPKVNPAKLDGGAC